MKVNLAHIVTAAVGLVACVAATPTPPGGVKIDIVDKRAVPVFSEWDPKQPDAAANLEKVERAYAEAVAMTHLVHIKPDAKKWDAIFKKYFQPDDKSNVEKVFAAIAGATKDKPDGDASGSDYYKDLVIINYRLDHKGDECEDEPDTLLAWLQSIEKDPPNRAAMRICPRAFGYPLLDGTKCSDLDEEVSGKMSTLGDIFLHESTHFDPIGKIATASRIIDYGNDGYGPVNTRKFNKNGNKPVNNADQYRWFAQEYYWTLKCEKDYKDPKNNKDYLKCKDNDSTCQVM